MSDNNEPGVVLYVSIYNRAWLFALRYGRVSVEVEAVEEAMDRHLGGITYNGDDIH